MQFLGQKYFFLYYSKLNQMLLPYFVGDKTLCIIFRHFFGLFGNRWGGIGGLAGAFSKKYDFYSCEQNHEVQEQAMVFNVIKVELQLLLGI